ncbi:MAG: glycosyltransferase [Candidatus Levybacteria bacterium]|nr:glycosyltransferase [Candidatus Levybacteria bacterium]
MKVALVHDYIKEYGGAERVLEALHELYPDAPVYTLVYLPKFLGPHRERFKDWEIKTSIAQFLPFKAKLISPLRLLAPTLFRRFDFKDFDVVIVSATGAYIPNQIQKGKAVQICYCHTPPRYLYGYATAREWKKHVVFRTLAVIANHFLRMTDFSAAKNVDYYIANSQEVQKRIEKFYRRDATVIYPPVDTNSKSETRNPKQSQNTKYKIPDTSYYLTGGRLARPKHVDLIVRVCTKMKLPLKVFGKAFAGYGEELRALAGPTVEFLGEVSDGEKSGLMRGAKAFLFASEDEDFGIVPVEAMAHGTPVIAYRSGGVKESVIDGKTGVFFDELTDESLSKAIKKFQMVYFNSKVCQKQAEKFGKKRFQEEIEQFIARAIKER